MKSETEDLTAALGALETVIAEKGVNPIADAYLARCEIRKRWPNLPSGISANEKFQQMVAILGKEPKLEEAICEDFFDVMYVPGSILTVEDLSKEWNISPHKARAHLYFMELCGRVWQRGRDFYVLCPAPGQKFPRDFWKVVDEQEKYLKTVK